jgi:DNA processing protein
MTPSPISRERFAALALWCVPGVNRDRLERLRVAFGTLSDALGGSRHELEQAGLSTEVAVAAEAAEQLGERALAVCERLDARILLPGDAEWPALFDTVEPRPGAVFVRGAALRRPAAAVVGSRQTDAYGLDFARALGVELAAAGTSVISGGALGVDGAAHAGALAVAGDASTVAVLGCGLDVRYPTKHRELFDEIASRGTLLSEFPPGTEPLDWHFPRRNRLIAALSDAVVVVRAATKSGSLITAREAAKLGIPLLAVPGPAGDPLSRGTNQLLRHGALLCEGTADVLAAVRAGKPTPIRQLSLPEAPVQSPTRQPMRAQPVVPPLFPSDAADERLLELLGAVPTSADALGRAAELSASQASAALTRLELLGLAVRDPGNLFHRSAA